MSSKSRSRRIELTVALPPRAAAHGRPVAHAATAFSKSEKTFISSLGEC
jgi:hypothetical protein